MGRAFLRPKPPDRVFGVPPDAENPEKQCLSCFPADAFGGKIGASEEEAGTDGKGPEGLQNHGVQGHDQPTEYGDQKPE